MASTLTELFRGLGRFSYLVCMTSGRQESLGSVLASEFVEMSLASDDKEEIGENILQTFWLHTKAGVHDIYNTVSHILDAVSATILKTPMKAEVSAKDRFGFNQIAVVASTSGKITGIRVNDHGSLAWTVFFKQPERLVAVQLFPIRAASSSDETPIECAVFIYSQVVLFFFPTLTISKPFFCSLTPYREQY